MVEIWGNISLFLDFFRYLIELASLGHRLAKLCIDHKLDNILTSLFLIESFAKTFKHLFLSFSSSYEVSNNFRVDW